MWGHVRLRRDTSMCEIPGSSAQSCVQVTNPTTIAFALTSIYRARYIRSMESAFTVLAEPSRRAILTLLASGERSVGDLEAGGLLAAAPARRASANGPLFIRAALYREVAHRERGMKRSRTSEALASGP